MRTVYLSLAVLLLLVTAGPRAFAQGQPLANAEAMQLARDAVSAGREGQWDACIAKDRASLELEDNARTRLHLAACLDKAGKLLDALKNASEALKKGLATNDELLMKVARERVMSITGNPELNIPARIAKVTFVPPTNVTDLKVTFDDRPVDQANLTKKFSVDPGKHTVKAEGTTNKLPLTYEETFEVKEGEVRSVEIRLNAPVAPGVLTQPQIVCLMNAKTQKEIAECLPQDVRTLVARAAMEVAGYSDSTNVHVLSPAVRASFNSPTSGWNVGANYLIDFVTAASPDIVSTASRRYRERRHVVGLTGGYKPANVGGQVYGNPSTEPDYLSFSGGGAITVDLKDKLITPRLGFTHTSDTIGRSDTPFDAWSRKLNIEEIEASTTFVLTPTSIVLIGATLAFERGHQSKPYRFVPTFPPQFAPRIPVGATTDHVNVDRAPPRPSEQLPPSPHRYSVGFRLAKRFSSATARIEERIYTDSWGLLASSTDGRLMVDATRTLRIWPHGRVHVQSGTSFHKLAYNFELSGQQVLLPTFRTTDRELAPLRSFTGGLGARLALSPPEATTQFGITVTGDAMYTQYLQSLFVTARTALYGAIDLDAEF